MVYIQTVLENTVHKIFWDFEIQADYRTPIRRPDQELIITKKLPKS